MKSRLSRRKFLGGAAVAIGLPYLDSLESSARAAVNCGARQRLVVGFVPCGIHMPDFTPTTTGKDWTMPHILAPLEPVRKKIAVLTGIDYHKTAEPATPPGGHGSGTGAFLTLRPVYNNANDPNRTSLDQKIATETAACNRPLPSLQLGIKTSGDGCDKAPSCSYLECISWSKNTPNPNVTDPRTAFDRIFTGFNPGASNAEAERRKARRISILDHVHNEAKSLNNVLGASDRIKMDEFMTSIRALETRIQNLGTSGGGGGGCTMPTKTTLTDSSPYEQRVPIMLDLAVLALQCDVTRVLTFMFARGTSQQDFKFLLGVSSPHHNISHHGSTADNLKKLRDIGRWEMEQWAGFLKRLDAITEADGKTLLDNTIAYFNSEISDGNAHRKQDMPIVLAGSAGGKLKVDGSHHMYTRMNFPRPTLGPGGGPHAIKVFVSIMNAFGLPDNTFGDGSATGPLPELMV
jgi:hypothetical protein